MKGGVLALLIGGMVAFASVPYLARTAAKADQPSQLYVDAAAAVGLSPQEFARDEALIAAFGASHNAADLKKGWMRSLRSRV